MMYRFCSLNRRQFILGEKTSLNMCVDIGKFKGLWCTEMERQNKVNSSKARSGCFSVLYFNPLCAFSSELCSKTFRSGLIEKWL